VVEIQKRNAMPFAVDPRPAGPDPTFISLDPAPVPGTSAASFAAGPDVSSIQSRRMRVLTTLRIDSASAPEANSCGSDRVQRLIDPSIRSTRPCLEGRVFRVALFAVPRNGGPYLPGVVDEREKDGSDIFSVRVIIVELHKEGRAVIATDLVFRRLADGSPHFVRMRDLVTMD
jgi:hypothetical protein